MKAVEDNDEFVKYQKIAEKQRIDPFDADIIACKQMLIAEEKSKNAKIINPFRVI